MTDGPTHYEILEVASDADAAEIRAAYRRLARTTHPDVNPGTTHIFALVKRAYEVLSDPAHRAEYDARLGRHNDTAPDDVDEDPGWGTESDWRDDHDVAGEDPPYTPPRPSPSPDTVRPPWMDEGWTDRPRPTPPHAPSQQGSRSTWIWCTAFAIVSALCLAIWTFEYPVGTICTGVISIALFGAMLSRRRGAETSVVMTLTYTAAAAHVLLGGLILLSADGLQRIVGIVWMALYFSYIVIGRKAWQTLGPST